MSLLLQNLNNVCQDFGKLKLKSGVIRKSEKSISLVFLADFNVDEGLNNAIKNEINSVLPKGFDKIDCNFEKLVAEKSFVITQISSFIANAHKALSNSLNAQAAQVTKKGYLVEVELPVETSAYEYVTQKGIVREIEEYLATQFVEEFSVIARDTGKEGVDFSKLEYKPTEKDLYKPEIRTFKVDEVTRLFDADDTKECMYIADTKNYLGDAYVAGVITRLEQRETKTGKVYYIVEINDRTGVMNGSVFPTKAQQPKMDKLEVGSEIIGRGEFVMRGEYRNFTFRSVNLCIFPKNFVPKQRESRPCPQEYSMVFPKPLEIETQDNFLEVKTIPECFKGRTFVVFDLETTGTDVDDKITEIGAVKMVDGVATEYFSTLVNPLKHIPPVVEELTGISDETVADAPTFDQVCGDFYKFCYGSTLVAHNMDFDSRFIKNQSKPLDYYFDNPLMDTLALARENIFGVSNYKLNTLCDKYGIVFRHHRAYSDALATSELFVEIIRIRGSLPF